MNLSFIPEFISWIRSAALDIIAPVYRIGTSLQLSFLRIRGFKKYHLTTNPDPDKTMISLEECPFGFRLLVFPPETLGKTPRFNPSPEKSCQEYHW
jgi:hypothetical protein